MNRQRPCFVAFDLVYLNSECIITQEWYVRRQLLESILRPKRGYLHLSEVAYGRTVEDIAGALDKAIADKCVAAIACIGRTGRRAYSATGARARHRTGTREEGLLIKNQHAKYAPNKRLSDHWIKLKPDYLDNVATDLDLLVIGPCAPLSDPSQRRALSVCV